MDEDVAGAVSGLPRDVSIWVAYSGGLDSTVLLHAAAAARPATTRAVHVNHRLQADSGAWEAHCRQTTRSLDVPIEVFRVAVGGGNLELAARKARYRVWRDLLGAGEVLLLAHHADDQAETVLWQLFTGRHVHGMPARRRLGRGRLERPFVGLRRARLCAYARDHGLGWIEDPMNADLRYDRSYIRHRILPLVEARFPRFVDGLEVEGDADPAAAAQATLAVADAAPGTLRAWLGVGLGAARVAEILRQAGARPDAAPAVRLPDGRCVRRYRDTLHVVADRPRQAERSVVAGEALALDHGGLTWHERATGVAEGTVLQLRYRRGGESIAPAGRGVHKRLTALFQEHGVPPWLRDGWPLLYRGDRLVAVPGIAIAAEAAASPGWLPNWLPSIELD